MAYLEELLPEFRKGAKIRLPLWEKGQYLRYDMKHKNIVNEKDEDTDIMGCHLSSDRWEFFQDPEPDWQYIIDNKCLCWFWDDCEKYSIEYGFLGFLTYVQPSNNTDRFEELSGKIWKNCRPVRRDELTFYEDREDD